LPAIKTIGELKVIIYTLRHTWGYQDDYKKITLDEFEKGRKRKDGSRIDNGTGLTKPTIVDGIKRAVADGFLFEHVDLSDTARVKKFYSLTQEGLKDLTPGVKTFNTWGKDSLHRTEKETVKKETFDNGSAENSKNQKPKHTPTERDALNKLGKTIASSGDGTAHTLSKLRTITLIGADIAKITRSDILAVDGQELRALAGLTIRLSAKGNITAKLKAYETWWYNEYWLGKDKGQPPTIKLMGSTWGQFEAAKVSPPNTANTGGPVLSDVARENYARLLAEQAK
jgi:DNA-binding PadR family transcriptional regulator